MVERKVSVCVEERVRCCRTVAQGRRCVSRARADEKRYQTRICDCYLANTEYVSANNKHTNTWNVSVVELNLKSNAILDSREFVWARVVNKVGVRTKHRRLSTTAMWSNERVWEYWMTDSSLLLSSSSGTIVYIISNWRGQLIMMNQFTRKCSRSLLLFIIHILIFVISSIYYQVWLFDALQLPMPSINIQYDVGHLSWIYIKSYS